jgi:hypothetical protein
VGGRGSKDGPGLRPLLLLLLVAAFTAELVRLRCKPVHVSWQMPPVLLQGQHLCIGGGCWVVAG